MGEKKPLPSPSMDEGQGGGGNYHDAQRLIHALNNFKDSTVCSRRAGARSGHAAAWPRSVGRKRLSSRAESCTRGSVATSWP